MTKLKQDIFTRKHYSVSIIIPIFNEAETIKLLIEKLLSLSVDCEIILVDDGSTDSSRKIIESLNYPNIRVLYHYSRTGKGLAVQTGLQAAIGDIVVIQDADLEYDPRDLIPMINMIELGQSNIVYGVRDISSQKMIIKWGNRFLTWITNKLYNHSISDMTTCYKVMPRELMQQLFLESKGFTIDAEITAKLFRLGYSIAEHPISYIPRYENKKLKIIDGFPMLWVLIKFRFKKRIVKNNVIGEAVSESA